MALAGSELYDAIGPVYPGTRRTDPRLAAAIWRALGDAQTVINVGAGTGSYEPSDRDLVPVEPSLAMSPQRAPGAAPVVHAGAEALPSEVEEGFALLRDDLAARRWHVRHTDLTARRISISAIGS